MNDLFTGFRGFSRAFGFALRHGMWWLFLVPVLLWLLFASGIVWVSSAAVDVVNGWLSTWDIDLPANDRTGLEGLWDDIRQFFSSARDVVVLVVVKLALWFLFGLVGKYIVLILLSPLLAWASERTEELITGRSYPFILVQFMKDVGRGILMAIRNGALELAINILVWTLTLFVALLAPVTVVLLWLVSSWFYGFSMFDYLYERRRLGIGASARAAWQRPGLILANGMLFNFLMNPPFLNWILGPLLSVLCFSVVPVVASIGAVLAQHEAEGGRY